MKEMLFTVLLFCFIGGVVGYGFKTLFDELATVQPNIEKMLNNVIVEE